MEINERLYDIIKNGPKVSLNIVYQNRTLLYKSSALKWLHFEERAQERMCFSKHPADCILGLMPEKKTCTWIVSFPFLLSQLVNSKTLPSFQLFCCVQIRSERQNPFLVLKWLLLCPSYCSYTSTSSLWFGYEMNIQ